MAKLRRAFLSLPVVIILCAGHVALAADPDPFELHAVAADASGHTREYMMPSRGSEPEMVLLDTTVLLDHTSLVRAYISHQYEGQIQIFIKLTVEGGKRFGEITTTYLNKRIGIVLDGKLYSAPVIKEQILGGGVGISGNFTEDEAQAIVKKLNESVSSSHN